ncbi:MAG: HAD-IA family hydrolase [Planctomycetota bacterium]|jgi:putative hydrolase of the HAD superfamily|nr:HAD-IA family hydrolase [Planctomycetota bacterium]
MGVKLILFDLMETVVADPFERVLPGRTGESRETLLAWHSSNSWIAFEQGLLDESGYMMRMFHTPGVASYSEEEFREWMLSGYRFRSGMEALLGRWKGKGIQMSVASNYPCWWRVVRDELRLNRFFVQYFVSCEMGIRKPDQEYFRKILSDTQFKPEQVVFVDDREENVLGADRLGIRSIRFRSAEQLQRDLESAVSSSPTRR